MSFDESVKLRDLVPEVAVEADGAPEVLVKRELRRAATDYCQDTAMWRKQIDPIYTVEGIQNYNLYPPKGAAILMVDKLTVRETDTLVARWDYEPPRTVTLHDDEPGDRIIDVDVRLKPSADADELDGFVWNEGSEAISSGALWRLYAMPGKPWTNPELSAMHRDIFRGAVLQRRIQENRGHDTRNRRVYGRRWI